MPADRDTRSLKLLSQFLARYDPQETERHKQDIYIHLVKNHTTILRAKVFAPFSASQTADPWPWRTTYNSLGWLRLYQRNQEYVDSKARMHQEKWAEEEEEATRRPLKPMSDSRRTAAHTAGPSTPHGGQRTAFTEQDDANLVQWLAIENPGKKGRVSSTVYERLVLNDDMWPWVKRHTASSWRERYKKNAARLDRAIEQYQQKHGLEAEDPRANSDKNPRYEIWAKITEAAVPEDIPQASSQKKTKAASSSKSKAKAKPPPVTEAAEPAPAETRPRTSSKAKQSSDAAPLSQKARGKRRAIPEEEEEGEEIVNKAQRPSRPRKKAVVEVEEAEEDEVEIVEEAEKGVKKGVEEEEEGAEEEEEEEEEGVQEDVLPVLKESLEEEEEEEPAQEDEVVMEVDPPRTRKTKVLLKEQPGWATMSNVDTEDDPEEEIDELNPEHDRYETPAYRAKTKSPKKPAQGPTPPPSDSPAPSTRPQKAPATAPAAPPSEPAPPSPPKRVLPRKRLREEMFADLEEEATTSTPRPAKRRALLTHQEGTFFNTGLAEIRRPGELFKNGRRKSGVDRLPLPREGPAGVAGPGAQVEWPPKRGKGAVTSPAKVAAKPAEKSEVLAESSRAKRAVVSDVVAPVPALAPVASQYNPFAEPSQIEEDADEDEEVEDEVVEIEEEIEAEEVEDQVLDTSSRSSIAVSPKRAVSIAATDIEEDDVLPPPPANKPAKREIPPPPETTSSKRSCMLPPQTPFRPQLLKGKGRAIEPLIPEAGPSSMRRHTLLDTSQKPYQHARPIRPRHSLPAAFRSPPPPQSSSSSRRSSIFMVDGISLSEEDSRTIAKAGLDVTLQQRAAQSGFPPDVVRHAFRAVGQLDLLDQWLRDMTHTIADAGQKVATRLVQDAERSRSLYHDESEESEEEVDELDPDGDQEMSWSEEQSSVYYPPENSRAALYLRKEAEKPNTEQSGSSGSSHSSGRVSLQEAVNPVVPAPPPAARPSSDSRIGFAQQILGKLRRR